jgi:hypothetical protein
MNCTSAPYGLSGCVAGMTGNAANGNDGELSHLDPALQVVLHVARELGEHVVARFLRHERVERAEVELAEPERHRADRRRHRGRDRGNHRLVLRRDGGAALVGE